MRPSPPIRDSKTAFVIYHFTVLGQTTLKYEEEDGRHHIGQSVPAERCWVVKVAEESGPYVPPEQPTWRIYFRVGDLSVREIAQEGPKPSDIFFLYSGTVINDDESRPVVAMAREPFVFPDTPFPLWAWPIFPVIAGQHKADQAVSTVSNRLSITLNASGSKTDAIHQIWSPGLPWWTSSDIGGLRESRLIETSDHAVVSR
jgi:hypothetical protein